MKLIDIHKGLKNNTITVEMAADALGITERDMNIRLTKWGDRLPLLLETLDKIASDEISRNEAAVTLGITPRAVNMLMDSWKVTRPIPDYLYRKATSAVKWDIRKNSAIDYIAGSSTLDEASEEIKVTTRQVRRWVVSLLDKHYGMVFKDLAKLSNARRWRLAEEIEKAEGIELAKRNVLNSITRGGVKIEDVAAQLVEARHRRKHGSV